jgi:predicted component of type VI protein secretion system
MLDERPKLETEVRAAREETVQRSSASSWPSKLGASSFLAGAIQEREADLARLDAQLADFGEPLHQRLAIIPGWVERQLHDLANVLSDTL